MYSSNKSQKRIQDGIDRLINNPKECILIQTRNAYERFKLYEYLNAHKFKHEKVTRYDEYMWYRSTDTCIHDTEDPNKPDQYKRPITYIKVYPK